MMKKRYLLVILILFILLSCKKVTDPIVELNGINGIWEEEYTWFNYLECIHPEDDSSRCMVTQISTLRLDKDEFTVQIAPSINDPLGIFDTLYTGAFWIESDTIFFDSDSFFSTQMMSYQLSENSLKLALLYDNQDGRTTIIPSGSFVWGNALTKLSGTFYRKR
jgi:hypothetical protein